jgi:hypothetical protein
MCYYSYYPKDKEHYLVMVPMLYGDNPSVEFIFHSTDQTEV